MNYVDSAMESGDQANITALKTMFGAQTFEHDDDFLRYVPQTPYPRFSLEVSNKALSRSQSIPLWAVYISKYRVSVLPGLHCIR